jgi:hypothetical protein
MMKTFFILSVLYFLGGCATMNGEQPINKRNIAERLKCPVEKITITNVGDSTTRRADGCGRSETYAQISTGFGGSWIPMQDLGTRAAFDFNCEKSQLKMTPFTTGRQVGVEGCEKRAVYSYIQTGNNNWDWIADSVAK